ncbi:AAA family ATPase [bacterium]|nr:AAA family ATPase [bacterium]
MSLLPVSPAHELAVRPEQQCWLVEDLWADEAVGIIGGEPKSGKSFLALDMAVAVASGTPCLRRYAVLRPGRVLLYAAEDALHVVRRRLDGICHTAGVNLDAIDVQVITAPVVRLDLNADQQSLAETVAHIRPTLLVLDPFVRLHRVDENASQQVAPLLAFLRQLQRMHHLAVVVVHHARKGAGNTRAGQALRGSSEFHAWGDSNLYLRRKGEHLTLTIEHRAAPGASGIPLRLEADGDALALQIPDPSSRPEPAVELTPRQRVEHALSGAIKPLPFRTLRETCRIRTATLCEELSLMTGRGQVHKTADGYLLADCGD